MDDKESPTLSISKTESQEFFDKTDENLSKDKEGVSIYDIAQKAMEADPSLAAMFDLSSWN